MNPSLCGSGDLSAVLCKIGELLNTIMPILIALAVVYFIWGVASYILAGDDEGKSKGRDKMIMGLIGLVVIVSIWGLVSILKNTFGLSNPSQGTVQIPCIPSPGVPC
ncbi:hypothetical protein A2914_02275 [Candidatus Nomurabacteria bacterium RIFCSPLOWO2_01_FULL_41_21]|uniref:Uncharacterized protein n=2 Tax=Candidatus Nomuraibacteriota TaxID=1752729 RepID=A0A1F6V2D0_9BACT|nr:MAG: hypothetical protein A2733_01665 [Candidatus Nomurabacteria bacterium RIFCSPHIGHO2_01_FULL_40_20]OGI88752.1 MAG: hypothetical protein A2914_02275 [Candidatus Nomurabacteria bacterium RIFCSPLOWO2_01_FULL_41_21]